MLHDLRHIQPEMKIDTLTIFYFIYILIRPTLQISLPPLNRIKKLPPTLSDRPTVSRPIHAFQPANPLAFVQNVNHRLDCTLLCMKHDVCISSSYIPSSKLCLLSGSVLKRTEILAWDKRLFSSIYMHIMNEDGYTGPETGILSHGHPAPYCGMSFFEYTSKKQRPKRIIGGWTPEPYRAPWVGVLVKDDRVKCTGFLISNNMVEKSSIWVLSAKHCFINDLWVDDPDRKLDLTPFAFLFGVQDLRLRTQHIVYRTIAEIFLPPDYGIKPKDLALIRLSRHIKFNSYINSLCLPDPEEFELFDGTICKTCGFGATKIDQEPSRSSDVLQCIDVEPQASDPRHDLNSDWNSVITLKAASFGSYHGDSGSPIFCRSIDPWSFAFSVLTGGRNLMLRNAYMMGARISYFMEFIDKKMNKNSNLCCPS